ncbi:helix-turn-helix domain-containing protein [Streptomyces atratus]|uniref:AraC-like ligand-binding domain-containing protein n=1 Tax=Streptomyces atratus TaxID=1893 RepID=UPI0033FC9483
MNAILDTASIPPRDRAEKLLQAIRESVVRIDVDHHVPPRSLSAKIRLAAVGSIGVCSVRSTGLTVRRTPQLAREDTEPAVFLGLQLARTSLVIQHGRQALLKPGDFALYDTTAPYTLACDAGVDHHFLRFPRAALALPERALREITAVTLGAGNPLAQLASAYFSRLATSDELPGSHHADTVVAPSVDLIRAAVTAQLGKPGLAQDSLEETLTLRIKEYVRAHLRDRDLSAQQIAAAHHISVRRLYTVLARSGISLGEWIRTQRLEGCRRELAAPAARDRTVASIGHSWGFVDATHFSKVFKQEFGVSPRGWRDLNHSS